MPARCRRRWRVSSKPDRRERAVSTAHASAAGLLWLHRSRRSTSRPRPSAPASAQGGSPRYLLPDSVLDYIHRNINCTRTWMQAEQIRTVAVAGAGRDQSARHRRAGHPQADVPVRLHDRRKRRIGTANQGAGAQRRGEDQGRPAAASWASRASRPENGYWWILGRRDRSHHAARDPRLTTISSSCGAARRRAASHRCAAARERIGSARH